MKTVEKLYHGTTFETLKDILKDGIRPRGENDSNWEGVAASRPDMVYLTSVYPLYFALAGAGEELPEKVAVIEVKAQSLNSALLHPDEDFIAQIIARNTGRPLEEVHEDVVNKLGQWQKQWVVSLEKMGVVSHKGRIRRKHMTRYAVLNLHTRYELWNEAIQPSITPANFMVMRDHYAGMIEWLFGDREVLPQVDRYKPWLESAEEMGLNKDTAQKSVDFWIEQSENRTGIEVHDVVQ